MTNGPRKQRYYPSQQGKPKPVKLKPIPAPKEVPTEDIPWECMVCNKSFTNEAKLDKHRCKRAPRKKNKEEH